MTSAIISVASKSKQQPNQKDRTSSFLPEAAASNIINAAWFAYAKGTPLNRFTTIHWQAGGVQDNTADATGRFLKLARDWLRLRGADLTYTWVRENGEQEGHHTHILLNLPPEIGRSFGGKQRAWLKATGVHYTAGVIKSAPIGRSLKHAYRGTQYGEAYADHLNMVLAYILKGVSPITASKLQLPKSVASGVITGRRCSTSENIGRTSRARADWADTLSFL